MVAKPNNGRAVLVVRKKYGAQPGRVTRREDVPVRITAKRIYLGAGKVFDRAGRDVSARVPGSGYIFTLESYRLETSTDGR